MCLFVLNPFLFPQRLVASLSTHPPSFLDLEDLFPTGGSWFLWWKQSGAIFGQSELVSMVASPWCLQGGRRGWVYFCGISGRGLSAGWGTFGEGVGGAGEDNDLRKQSSIDYVHN